MYDEQLTALIHKHSPFSTVRHKYLQLAPWLDSEKKRARRRCIRMLQRKFRRTSDIADRLAWIQKLRAMHDLYENKRHRYRCSMITDNRSSAKQWRTFSWLTGPSANHSSQTTDHKAENFAQFFSDKTDAIRAETAPADPLIIENTDSGLLDS
jgi:hypothetical protein